MDRGKLVVSWQCLWVLGVWGVVAIPTTGKAGDGARPKNVIVMIADGCSSEQYTLARWFRDNRPLALDGIRVGAVKTYIADSVVADSAPAATAFATGVRTSDKLIGVGPTSGVLPIVPEPGRDLRYRPLATVLEGARLLGKGTGVISTSRVTHATPAAYMAHAASRKDEEDIMEQAVYQGIDVVLGGGRGYVVPKTSKGKRTDGEDLWEVLGERGYQRVRTAAELEAAKSCKVFGLFASGHLSPEIDRAAVAPHEPTLARMTAKAIEILSKRPAGFFLMVEGSQIDWACHANDPAQLLGELLAYDQAVKVAMEFARRDRDTLLIALSDHNTGGMSIGNQRSNKSYSQMKMGDLVDPLRNMKRSAAGIWKELCGGRDPEEVDPGQISPKAVWDLVRKHWNVELTPGELALVMQIAKQDPENPHNGLGEVVSASRTYVGWTSHGHVGGDVPLFAFGPGRPVGLFDGPQIGQMTAEALGIDLDRLTGRLLVDLAEALPDAQVSVDETSDPANPVVVVTRGPARFELPVNKNVLRQEGAEMMLEGVVVYVRITKRAFAPLQAVRRILGQTAPLPPVER